jgi:non-ribosomal peptide synthetase component F
MMAGGGIEMWVALLNGERVVLLEKWEEQWPEKLKAELRNGGVSRMFLPTALFEECVRSGEGILEGVEEVVFGGEMCNQEQIRRGMREEGVGEVLHVYGAAETATVAACGELRGREKGGAVGVGRPVENTRIYILDKEMEAVGLGVPGEIYVGG